MVHHCPPAVRRLLKQQGLSDEEIEARLQPGEYEFNFGKHRGDTIEQVWRKDPSYISNFIVMRHLDGDSDLSLDRPDLMDALRDISDEILDRNPVLRATLEHTSYMAERPSIFDHEVVTDRGTLIVNERSRVHNFWEATDRRPIALSHQNAPEASLTDLEHLSSATNAAPVFALRTGTVISVDQQYDASGKKLPSKVSILPSGWPIGLDKQHMIDLELDNVSSERGKLKELVYRTVLIGRAFDTHAGKRSWVIESDLWENPELVAAYKGCCFIAIGMVKEVKEREAVMHVTRDFSKLVASLKSKIRILLGEGIVEQPEVGAGYEFKGFLEQGSENVDFRAEVCKKLP
jgi:hypothetical protein